MTDDYEGKYTEFDDIIEAQDIIQNPFKRRNRPQNKDEHLISYRRETSKKETQKQMRDARKQKFLRTHSK